MTTEKHEASVVAEINKVRREFGAAETESN